MLDDVGFEFERALNWATFHKNYTASDDLFYI